MVLGEERFYSFLVIAIRGLDLRIEVGEGDKHQNRVAEFGVFFLINTPETFGVQLSVCNLGPRKITLEEYLVQVF